MHLRLLLVGDKQPAWVDAACENYTRRFPSQWKYRLDALPVVKRAANSNGEQEAEQESIKLLDRVADNEFLVLLDERGKMPDTLGMAKHLENWQAAGQDVVLLIGGPDGVTERVRQRADFCWSLSPLTLPHALARILLCEQLYRMWSVTIGHPYHRP